jgi:hypothetical protein
VSLTFDRSRKCDLHSDGVGGRPGGPLASLWYNTNESYVSIMSFHYLAFLA